MLQYSTLADTPLAVCRINSSVLWLYSHMVIKQNLFPLQISEPWSGTQAATFDTVEYLRCCSYFLFKILYIPNKQLSNCITQLAWMMVGKNVFVNLACVHVKQQKNKEGVLPTTPPTEAEQSCTDSSWSFIRTCRQLWTRKVRSPCH